MNRAWILMVVAACAVLALPQTSRSGEAPYQPAVPAANTVNAYGGWGGNTGGTTAAGSAMNGMASVISSAGQYNLSTSAAAINMTQAQKNSIQNQQLGAATYFEMRAANKAAVAAERGPPPTMEQLARIARDGVPKTLSPSEIDPVSGQLAWPSALQQPNFETQRTELDQLFATWARYGGLTYADQSKARQTIEAMFRALKAQIREIPPQDYVVCKSFLQSLSYTATKTELQ